MKSLIAAVALTAFLGAAPVRAQTVLDHEVQKTWDNIFNPGPPGDPRTNWERRRDRVEGQRAEVAQHNEYCRYHPNAGDCPRLYGRPAYYGR